MKKMVEYYRNCIIEMDIKDVALLKICLMCFGLMLGISIPSGKKKPVFWVSLFVFIGTAVALFAGLFGFECPFCGDDEDDFDEYDEYDEFDEYDDLYDEYFDDKDFDDDDYDEEGEGFVMKIVAEEQE